MPLDSLVSFSPLRKVRSGFCLRQKTRGPTRESKNKDHSLKGAVFNGNPEPQQYGRTNAITGTYLPMSLHFYDIPTMFWGFCVWSSRKFPLHSFLRVSKGESCSGNHPKRQINDLFEGGAWCCTSQISNVPC